MMDEKLSFGVSRIAGKGTNNSAASVLVPVVDKLTAAETGDQPALFIIGVLTSEKPIGADKILGVTFETMANKFYEGSGKVLSRLSKIAGDSQDILADLFFKAGFGDKPFKVTLDIGLLAVQDGVFYVWIDGEISISIVRGQKSIDLRKAFGKLDKERFEGSGRLKKDDKILMLSNFVEKKSWVLDQLRSGSLKSDAVLSSMGSVGSEEVLLVLDYNIPKATIDVESKTPAPKRPRKGKVDWEKMKLKTTETGKKIKDSPFWGKAGEVIRDWWKDIGYAVSAILGKITGSPRKRVLQKSQQDTAKIIKGVAGIILVVGLCALLVVFINRTFNNKKEIEEYQTAYNALKADVEGLENNLGDMTFSTSEKIDAASSIVSKGEELKNNEFADEDEINAMIDRALAAKDTLTNTVAITEVNVVADLGVSLEGVTPVDFEIKGTDAYVLDAQGKRVYTVDLISGESNVYASSDMWQDPKFIAWSQSYLLVYDGEAGMFKVNEGGTVEKIIGLSAFQSEVSEFTTYAYADNLYFLLPEKRAIYKSIPAGSGYSVAQEYTDSPLPVGSEDATIDGAIYVIGRAGDIKKFDYRPDGSIMSNIAISGLQAPLGADCKLTTPLRREVGQQNYLYVLDPTNNRVVVINKTSDNGNSYIASIEYRGGSPWFENLKEIKLTQDERYAVLLDGSALIKIDLSQF